MASHFKVPDIKRAVEAARSVGINVNSVNILPDGTIQVAELDQPMSSFNPDTDFEGFYNRCSKT